MAKKSWIVKARRTPKFSVRHVQPLPALWSQPRLHAQVRRLPHLLPRAGLDRASSLA